jgi:hypothetical protein
MTNNVRASLAVVREGSKARQLAVELAEVNGMDVGGWTLTPTMDGGAVISITLRPKKDDGDFEKYMRETGEKMASQLPQRNASLGKDSPLVRHLEQLWSS